MSKKQKAEVYRAFLHSANHENNKSFVTASQGERSHWDDTHELTIGGCRNNVTLYFEGGKEKRNSIAKIQKLRAALNKIETWLEKN